MLIKNVILLSITIHAGLSGAASHQSMLPFTGKKTLTYTRHDDFFIGLRNNNAAYVEHNLREQLQHPLGGKLTPLHIAVAMEFFHGHNPKSIIDAFAKVLKDSYPHGFAACCNAKANVNHPDFYYLCTGKKREEHTAIRLMLTPIELVSRYKSIRTLCAIDMHTDIAASSILKAGDNPEFSNDSELFERIIVRERYRVSGAFRLEPRRINHIVKNFGDGMQLLHKHGIVLFDPLTCPEYATFLSRSERFIQYPAKVNAQNDLRAARQKSVIDSVKDWFGCRR